MRGPFPWQVFRTAQIILERLNGHIEGYDLREQYQGTFIM